MFKRSQMIVIVALIIALVGCTSSAKPKSEDAAPQQITLDFPSWQAEEPGFSDWWKGLIAEFTKQHPEAKINFTSVPFKNYTDTLLTRFAANEPPDIVHLPSAALLQFASNDWLEPLDELFKDTDIPQKWTKLQQNMVLNGKTQGLLLLGYGFNLYYNEKLLTDAGVQVPTTPEELLAAAKALTKNGIYGFGSTTVEMDNMFNEASSFIVGEGQSWVKDGQYNLTDPAVVKALDDYRALLKLSPQGVSVEQKRQLFFDGKIAMIIDGPFIYGQAKSDKSAVAPYVKVAPSPFKVSPGNISNNLSMAKNISPEKKKLVGEFIKLAASPEWQAKYAELTNSPVPRQGAISEQFMNSHPEMKVFNQVAENAVSIIPDSQNINANFNQFSKTVQSSMMELMITDRPTADVLASLQDKLSKTIKP